MHRTIVIAFSPVDGIIEDPDGSAGSPVIVGPAALNRYDRAAV